MPDKENNLEQPKQTKTEKKASDLHQVVEPNQVLLNPVGQAGAELAWDNASKLNEFLSSQRSTPVKMQVITC